MPTTDMLNFTVGPVMTDDALLAIGAEQVPYFRTPEFSLLMKENEARMLTFAGAPRASRAVFLTGSGTAAMEASVMNTLTEQDRVLVVNGGSFGQRFVELLTIHRVPFTELRMETGRALREADLLPYDGAGYTAFVINAHETSTGVLYDMELVGSFCRRNGLFLLVDAISAFLADDIDMERMGIDVLLTGSQKALACAPGVSIVVLSPRAIERTMGGEVRSLYLDLKAALRDGERGQTPFTPAVGILRQIHARLLSIEQTGGVAAERARITARAAYFRERIAKLPFAIAAEHPSSAVTALRPTNGMSAYEIFTTLKDSYGMWVCPNGGALRDTLFRVGHIGALTLADYDRLLDALRALCQTQTP